MIPDFRFRILDGGLRVREDFVARASSPCPVTAKMAVPRLGQD